MEKIMNCKACNGEIANGVNKCPHCGRDQKSQHWRWLSIFIVG